MTPALSLEPASIHFPSSNHALDCMAGFYESEAQALGVAQQLLNRHGLRKSQGMVLGPADAGWLTFRRAIRTVGLGRHLDGLSWLSDGPMMALLGGMGSALILAFGIFWVGLQDLSLALVLVVTGALIGTTAGWAASGFSARASRYRRFRRDIRIQLVAGHWAVLAHEVPGTHQAAAVQLLREGSIGWCALSAPWLQL